LPEDPHVQGHPRSPKISTVLYRLSIGVKISKPKDERVVTAA